MDKQNVTSPYNGMLYGSSDGGSAGKESTCNAGDPGSIPGSGISPGEGIGSPLQYSWTSLVAQMVKNPPLMQETWVQSLGWKIPWRREQLPTPVLSPGELHEQRNLAGYSPWGFKESNTTEQLSLSNGILFRCKKEWGDDTHDNIDEPGRHYTKWNKSNTNEQILYDSTYVRYLECANS